MSIHTLNAYRFDLRDFSTFVVNSSAALDGAGILAYSSDLAQRRQAAPRTVKRRMACLRGFFKDLVRERLVETSPFENLAIELPRTKSLPRALAREDAKRLTRAAWRICNSARSFDATAVDFAAAVLVLLSVGLRVSELVQLRMTDFDPEEGGLRVLGKGRRDRSVFIVDAQLRKLLATPRDATKTWLLGSPRGPWSTQAFRQQLRIFARDAGVSQRVTPHMLRHTAATLVNGGAKPGQWGGVKPGHWRRSIVFLPRLPSGDARSPQLAQRVAAG